MFDPRKHYTGAWTLQGRLITDFDENDGKSILSEEGRRARLDMIGPYGSPDDGFRIGNVRVEHGFLNFDILAGSLYLGGLRLELEETQSYGAQRDHLQAKAVRAGSPERRFLVLLEAFEAAVTPEEDSELLDPAIGVGSSARNRRFQRIHVVEGVGAKDCAQAWQYVEKMLEKRNMGTLGEDYGLIANTRLTVSYAQDEVDDELCDPPLTGGYLGAENQAMRVQLTGSNRFTWGFDNASPLYRITLSADRKRATLMTTPRDRCSTPVAGQVIEILPWGAALSNGEKTAGLSGHMTRITLVNPSDASAGGAMTVTLADPVPSGGFEEWRSRPDAGQLGKDGVFYYMHIWNRGGDITSPPEISFTPGTPVTLGATGIKVAITGDEANAEDYWIIAARPETPTQVYPWELEKGAAPEGVRRCFAPLALIHWKDEKSFEVSDCRPPFRPLTSIKGCCTYSVGDGRNSDGDYNDLETALERLGANGGEICLLPGVHSADVTLEGRSNITIRGCGSRSKLTPKKPDGGGVIRISDCAGIGLFNFEVISIGGTGVSAELVDGLRIEDVKVLAWKVGLDVEDGRDVTIRRCTVRMFDKEGGDVGIYALADRLRIEDCDIRTISGGELPAFPGEAEDNRTVDPTGPCANPGDFYADPAYLAYYVDLIWGIVFDAEPQSPYETLGGVQIGSGSEGVTVRNNTIIGGSGNGVTLGSDIADLHLEEQGSPSGGVEGFPSIEFTHEYSAIRGKVLLNNVAIGGVTITFDDGRNNVYSFPVDESGIFEGKLPSGEYVVSIADSNFAATEITPLGKGDYYVFVKERDAVEPPRSGEDLLAFIHDVAIEGNRIANMGFSGIGAPRFVSADAAALREFGFAMRSNVDRQLLYLVYIATGAITGFVVDLTIARNTIVRCLRNAPLTNLDQFAIERALGGISLALCDRVSIVENTVQDCGQGAELPVCGVFISFSVDVKVRDNRILNNGQDRRAEQAIEDFAITEGASLTHVTTFAKRGAAKANQVQYTSYRTNLAAGNILSDKSDVKLGRGPRAAILLPICLSSNVFAGGAATATAVRLGAQGMTGSAQGRHAARIDGNYAVQPFGKTLFIGAAGPLSITGNQLISDQALPRGIDALAGGLSGRIAAAMVISPVDLFASNVMVVDICPGSYIVDAIKYMPELGKNVSLTGSATAIPFGFPDGGVLFSGNQIKQGDAGARTTSVTVFSMDDVSFVDNQIDVLNATDILTTAVVCGATARAANNRLKEPVLLALQQDGSARKAALRFSLLEVGLFAAGMIGNQGHFCFKMYTMTNFGEQSANSGLLSDFMDCGEGVVERLPSVLSRVFVKLLTASAKFAEGLSMAG